MLTQHRDKIENLIARDIVRIHGRTLVASGPAAPAALAYKGEIHKVVIITGVDLDTLAPVRAYAVPDQHVTIIR